MCWLIKHLVFLTIYFPKRLDLLHLFFLVENDDDSLGLSVRRSNSGRRRMRRVVSGWSNPIGVHLGTVTVQYWPSVIVASGVGRDVRRRSLFEGGRVENRDSGRFQVVVSPRIVRQVTRKGHTFHSDHWNQLQMFSFFFNWINVPWLISLIDLPLTQTSSSTTSSQL